MRVRASWLSASAAVAAIAVASAQTPELPPIPYVASVKVNASGSPESFTRRLPGGTFLASNMALHDMIAFSHGLQHAPTSGRANVSSKSQTRSMTSTSAGPSVASSSDIG